MDPNILHGPPVPTELLTNINSSLCYFVTKCAEEYKDCICMIDGITGEQITIKSVLEDSLTLAAELQSFGCKPGLVIGVISENRLEYPAIVLAILRTGATVCCFNPSYSIGELEHTLKVVQPHLMFTSSYADEKLLKLYENHESTKRIIHLDKQSCRFFLSYKDILRRKSGSRYVQPKISGESTAMILFSSGSTGLPKGVMLPNKSIVFLLEAIRYRSLILSPDSGGNVSLSVIPMFHGYGVMLLFRILILRDTVVILNKFKEDLFLDMIQRYKVTTLSMVPALMVFIAKHPLVSQYDLSSVKEVGCGAAPLSPTIEEEVKRKLNLPTILKGYGMTETTIICTSTATSEDKPGAVGKLWPAMSAKVIDLQSGETLGANQEGEICFKGMLVMQGYYNNEKETKEAIDTDGWLHTGDVGYYDEDEDFFIVDRIKDLIKYKGFQVAPAELEALLLNHEAVKDAAVIGVPDEISGEVPRAFVVKQKDVGENELIGYVANNVGPHMKLRGGVVFLETIPRNQNGKILRKDLRAWSKSKL